MNRLMFCSRIPARYNAPNNADLDAGNILFAPSFTQSRMDRNIAKEHPSALNESVLLLCLIYTTPNQDIRSSASLRFLPHSSRMEFWNQGIERNIQRRRNIIVHFFPLASSSLPDTLAAPTPLVLNVDIDRIREVAAELLRLFLC